MELFDLLHIISGAEEQYSFLKMRGIWTKRYNILFDCCEWKYITIIVNIISFRINCNNKTKIITIIGLFCLFKPICFICWFACSSHSSQYIWFVINKPCSLNRQKIRRNQQHLFPIFLAYFKRRLRLVQIPEMN